MVLEENTDTCKSTCTGHILSGILSWEPYKLEVYFDTCTCRCDYFMIGAVSNVSNLPNLVV